MLGLDVCANLAPERATRFSTIDSTVPSSASSKTFWTRANKASKRLQPGARPTPMWDAILASNACGICQKASLAAVRSKESRPLTHTKRIAGGSLLAAGMLWTCHNHP